MNTCRSLIGKYIPLACLLLLLPEYAHAATQMSPEEMIQAVGSALGLTAGTEGGQIISNIAILFIPLINAVAIVAVIISGITLAFSQGEDEVGTARRTIIACIAAIMLVNGAAALRSAIFSPSGVGIVEQPDASAALLRLEIEGVISWALIPLVTIAVLMVIISAIRAVLTWNSDEGLSHLRRAVVGAIAGLTLIALRYAISIPITGTGNPDTFIFGVIQIINTLLGFLALIAVVVICIAGIMMILNIGNDEQYTRARNLILWVAIGLLVVIASWAIVNVVFAGTTTV